MAFRHGDHGTLTRQGVVWKCPSCGRENATPLEQGCACGAGADATVATERVVLDEVSRIDSPFEAWMRITYPQGVTTNEWVVAHAAWEAGVAWAGRAQGQSSDPIPSGSQGGYVLGLVKTSDLSSTVMEVRTQATILAALDFYLGNQLAYGAVPGQLSAAECQELIAKLRPVEETEG